MITRTIYQPILPPLFTGIVCVLVLAALILMMLRRKEGWLEILQTGLRTALLLLLIFLMSLRPMRGRMNTEVVLKNMDVLFVVDTTISMWAEDYGTDGRMRISAVREDINRMMEGLPGCNFALVTFDNRGRVLSPFTQDTATIRDALLVAVAPDRNYASGSAFDAPYEAMEELLISSSQKENRKTWLFFISDGERSSPEETPAFGELLKYVDGGAVLCYGTEEGGPMWPQPGYAGWTDEETNYILDPATGQPAVSRADPAHLGEIAAQLGIGMEQMRVASDVDRLVAAVNEAAVDVPATVNEVQYEETYQRYVIPALLLVIFSMVRFIRRGKP